MTDALRGRLIVATPDLADPNFSSTVVLLLEHGPDGALGVVLNRPSDLEVREAFADWCPLVSSPPVVFVGGPVQPNAVIALARGGAGLDEWEPVVGDVGVVNLGLDVEEAVGRLGALRIFAGYAGWGAGQLEAELASGSWFTVDAEPDDAFSDAPERLWRAVLTRQGGVFTTVTEDPSLN